MAAQGKAHAKPASGKSPSNAAAASAPASAASIAEDCRMIGTIVRGVVNTANPALEADQFTAAINQLEALHVGDPQLKSDLAQYVKLLQDVVTVDRAAASFQRRRGGLLGADGTAGARSPRRRDHRPAFHTLPGGMPCPSTHPSIQ